MYKAAKWIDTHYDNKWQCPKLFIKTFHFTFYQIIVYDTLLWWSRLRIFEEKNDVICLEMKILLPSHKIDFKFKQEAFLDEFVTQWNLSFSISSVNAFPHMYIWWSNCIFCAFIVVSNVQGNQTILSQFKAWFLC